jgi:ribosomal protein S18 acetylase RimI-like enzyme
LAPQLRRLALPIGESLSRAISEFDCLGGDGCNDPVAENVNGFLAEGRFEPGLRHGISATYLFVDGDAIPSLVGYATLTFDSVRLTNAERKRMEDLAGIAEFGALRIQMIGVDHRHQGEGQGRALLEGITGLARKLSEDVAVRFLLADANVRKVGWYENAGFVRNQAKREIERLNPERSISMRLDLLDILRGEGEDQAERGRPAVERLG